jgi:fumarate hydratase class II
MGHDVAIGIAASQGQLELNAFKPLIVYDVLDSLRLLTDGMDSFSRHCIEGIEIDAARIQEHLARSLMLITGLAPHIGYERAAHIARHAHDTGLSLRDAALAVDSITPEDFDAWADPQHMLGVR